MMFQFRILTYFICAALLAAGSAASAQSDDTLAGMAAYNRGDFDSAFRLLSQASAAGDPQAHVNLGYLYVRGHGVTRNADESFRLYQLAAKGGSSEGMNALGVRYQNGSSVEKDPEQAAYWYCEAVLRGNPRAMNNLGLILVSGEVEVDEPKARNLWEQAAALGNSNGWYNLSISYRYGYDQDVAKADEMMILAARAGHEGAQISARQRGHAESFPSPVIPGIEMRPEPQGATGRTKECALYLS